VGAFIVLSIVALIGAWAIRFGNRAVSIGLFVALIAAAFGVVYILYGDIVSKGVELSIWDNLGMFVSMLTGMSAKYFFDEFDKEDYRFEIRKFVKPLWVAPIVFLVTYVLIDVPKLLSIGTLTILKIYLLSFTNGFFWAFWLDRVKKKVESSE